LREDLDQLLVTSAAGLAQLSHGRRVRVAGLVLMRQRPSTAKGITFVTLEDETGIVNLIIRPNVWEQHREAARGAGVLAAQGILERQHQVTHVNVSKLADFSHLARELQTRSRDFR
jgi:error-prone DNA polymerase